MIKTAFKIPCLPPSINQMYKINYRTKAVYLDESVAQFKKEAFLYIPPIKMDKEKKYKMHVEYHGKFHNNDGTIKRRDGQNLDKCLYDIIFEKLAADDKQVWEGSWIKINDSSDYTLVTIEEFDDVQPETERGSSN